MIIAIYDLALNTVCSKYNKDKSRRCPVYTTVYGELVYFTFFVPRKKCCDFLKLLSSPQCMLTVIRPWADHFQNWVCVKGLDVYTAENKYVLFHTVPKEIDIP